MNPLPSWIADPALRPTWERILARFERAGLEARGTVVVTLADRDERHCVGALLGRSVTRDRVRIDLAVLDARLQERSGFGGLHTVLEQYFGTAPQDRPAVRAARDAARERPLTVAAELVQQPWASEWIAGLRQTGVLTSRPSSETTVRDAATVLNALTGPGRTVVTQSRVEIGARLLGDAHGLDRDRLLHQVVLRGLAAAAGTTTPEGTWEREQLWARFGVEPDLLSRTCLVWRLRSDADAAVAQRLRIAADAGDPVHITERDRRQTGPLNVDARTRVLVCENPRVIEALAQHQVQGWAAVCTAGEPNLVVDRVLRGLTSGGVKLRYHGDFDWAGVAITNRAIERYAVRPWMMTAEHYSSAVRADGPQLRGAMVEPRWDQELGAAMRNHGRAVHEESVLAELLDAMSA